MLCSPFNYTLSAITTIMDLRLLRSSDRADDQAVVCVSWLGQAITLIDGF